LCWPGIRLGRALSFFYDQSVSMCYADEKEVFRKETKSQPALLLQLFVCLIAFVYL